MCNIPRFGCNKPPCNSSEGSACGYDSSGMIANREAENELRDWFAGQALAGLCAAGKPVTFEGVSTGIPQASYAIADAMMKERAE